MHTHADKTHENKNQSVSNGESQMQSGGEATFEFEDNRPKAIAQRKLQEIVNNSPQVSQLKAFQNMANNIQSKQSIQLFSTPIIQRVEADETGAYIGYTMGGDAPTFYFENGHFTQVHSDSDNIGWHPNKGDRHFIKNIKEESRDEYEKNRGVWDRNKKTKFGLEIESGKHDAKEGEGVMIEGDIKVKDGNEKVYLHPSRGRFIKPTEKDSKYSASDAISAASKGGLAKNEKKKS